MVNIKNIICCCGNGLVSSMMMCMNVQSILSDHDIQSVEVFHKNINEIEVNEDTLVIIQEDMRSYIKKSANVVLLKNIMDKKEIEKELKNYFNF